MSLARARRHWLSASALALVALDALVRLAVGEPYPGATCLLLAACGLSLLPLLPAELARPSVRVAALPALGIASFSLLLTSVSIVGIPLTESSIRLAVAALVVALAAVCRARDPGSAQGEPAGGRARRAEWLALAGLAAVFLFALAASWDVVDPFSAHGTDWGHYLLYSDEVAAQKRLLIDDPLAGEQGQLFADPPAIGAVYGSFRILDGISSWSLGSGIAVVSAVTVLSVYAAVTALWGLGAGLLAAAAYAVAPVRLEPLYWHGLATTLALVFVPLVLLALGLLYRGRRGASVLALFALALLGVALSHTTSAVVVALFILAVPIVELVRELVAERGSPARAVRRWWREGLVRPLVAGLALAVIVGAGAIAHLRLQAADLGSPVSYRFFEPDWLDVDALRLYYSWAFLALTVVSLALVLSARRLRRDDALLAVGALALASVVVSQLWRLHVPFEYRRSVYYLGVAMVAVIGVSWLRHGRRAPWIAAYALALAYVAHASIGLRLPERLLDGSERQSAAVAGLRALRTDLDDGDLPDAQVVVADRCLHFVVPYLLRRPTIAAFEDWQVGFSNRVPLARTAARVLEGGPEGQRVAKRLHVRYVVADPRCTPDPARGLGGRVAIRNDELVVVVLPGAA